MHVVTADRLGSRTHDRAGCWQVAIMALTKFEGATSGSAAYGCLRGWGALVAPPRYCPAS